MQRHFYDWLRTLTADGDISRYPADAWWTACETFAESATLEDLLRLAWGAYERPQPGVDSMFRNHVREYDDKFPLRDQNRLISVLTAATLIHLSEQSSYDTIATYTRLCAYHAGWSPVVEDLVVTPTDITELSERQRRLPQWPTIKASLNLAGAKAHVSNDDDFVNGAALHQAFDDLGKAVSATIARSVGTVLRTAKAREAPLLEQAELLVWLLAGRSTVLDEAWKEVSPITAAVCAAIEVDALSAYPTGRPDATSLISFAVASAGEAAKTQTDHEKLAKLLQQRVGYPDAVDREMLDSLVPLYSDLRQGIAPTIDADTLGGRLHDELVLLRAYEKEISAG